MARTYCWDSPIRYTSAEKDIGFCTYLVISQKTCMLFKLKEQDRYREK
jgi:hypothetical protein